MNGSANVNAGVKPPTEVRTDASPSAPATTDSAKDVPVAAPVELSKEVKTDSAESAKDESAVEGWGATASAATGLPPARAPRLVEKNPHTLYVKGLPQPCTDDELRGLWKEDIRSKVSCQREKANARLTITLQITKTKIPVHPNGQNKDYGYVEFGNDEDMQAALKNNAGVRRVMPKLILTDGPCTGHQRCDIVCYRVQPPSRDVDATRWIWRTWPWSSYSRPRFP